MAWEVPIKPVDGEQMEFTEKQARAIYESYMG
jgi:hypothetical protein